MLADASPLPGTLDPSFNTGEGPNGSVGCIATQPDGKILILGQFTSVNGTPFPGIARLHKNGSVDGTFTPPSDLQLGWGGPIGTQDLVVQPDGKILVSGGGLRRLNSDGSLDAGFFISATELIGTIALQSDGKILVGGRFYSIQNQPRQYLARVNADGSLDSSFVSEKIMPDMVPEGGIYKILLQPDGKFIAAGTYYLTADSNFGQLVRFNSDGSIDRSYSGNYPGPNYIFSMAWTPEGKLMIAGSQGYFPYLQRLNPDRSLDPAFTPEGIRKYISPGHGIEGNISSVAVQPDGKVIIGGDWITNYTRFREFLRLDANGKLDVNFNAGAGADGAVNSVRVQADGKILIAGAFKAVNGEPKPRIARIYGDFVPPQSTVIRQSDGCARVVMNCEPWKTYALECSPDFRSWFPLATNLAVSGYVDFSDCAAIGQPTRFYRLRQP